MRVSLSSAWDGAREGRVTGDGSEGVVYSTWTSEHRDMPTVTCNPCVALTKKKRRKK